jgi:hypothetical protein
MAVAKVKGVMLVHPRERNLDVPSAQTSSVPTGTVKHVPGYTVCPVMGIRQRIARLIPTPPSLRRGQSTFRDRHHATPRCCASWRPSSGQGWRHRPGGRGCDTWKDRHMLSRIIALSTLAALTRHRSHRCRSRWASRSEHLRLRAWVCQALSSKETMLRSSIARSGTSLTPRFPNHTHAHFSAADRRQPLRLDLNALEAQLKATKAIGLFTKTSQEPRQ